MGIEEFSRSDVYLTSYVPVNYDSPTHQQSRASNIKDGYVHY